MYNLRIVWRDGHESHFTIPREHDDLQSPIRSDDLEIIGWGELYRTREDAERHAFG
jgi:hypothetical protein